MKRKLLPLAIGAAIAMPGVALAEPTVYGKVNVSLEANDADNGNDLDDSKFELNSNASRLGVKGKEKISDNFSAIYKLEYEVAVDDGKDVFKQRNIYGGFKGGFGTVQAGNFDTPTKTAQKKIDMFNNLSGDIKNYLVGENRSSNLIQYTTPDMGPISAKLAIQPGEETEESSGDDARDGIGDGISASVAFDQDGIYVALAADSEMKSKLVYAGDDASALMDGFRLVAQADIDIFTIGFLYQAFEASDGDNAISVAGTDLTDVEQEGFVLSGAVKVGDGKIKAQYGQSTTEGKVGDESGEGDADQFAVGYDHKLSKQTKVYAYVNAITYELGDDDDYEDTTVGVGMEHKF